VSATTRNEASALSVACAIPNVSIRSRLSLRAAGPPAPPRDGIPEIGNLMECFTF